MTKSEWWDRLRAEIEPGSADDNTAIGERIGEAMFAKVRAELGPEISVPQVNGHILEANRRKLSRGDE